MSCEAAVFSMPVEDPWRVGERREVVAPPSPRNSTLGFASVHTRRASGRILLVKNNRGQRIALNPYDYELCVSFLIRGLNELWLYQL